MEEKQLRLLRFDFATAKDDIARLVYLVNTPILQLMQANISANTRQIYRLGW